MNLLILPSKSVGEDLPIVFPFFGSMQFGETIIGSTVTASVFSGEDPNPSSIISGVSTDDGTSVNQLITGGIAGVIYTLSCVVVTSESHRYSKVARLYVVSDEFSF